jgi:hypothetical protein
MSDESARKSPMAEALRAEVIRLCTEGDLKMGGAFTVELAMRIEGVVSAGRQILLAEKVSASDVEALLRRRRKNGLIINGGIVGDDFSSDDGSGITLASSSASENFGMSAIRQLVEGMRVQSESPLKLVEALAAARQHGLDDVVRVLEDKLGVGKSQVALPPVGEANGVGSVSP